MNEIQYIIRLENYFSQRFATFSSEKEPLFFSVSDHYENHSPIFINLSNVTVGIGNTCEFFDEFEDKVNIALWRFLTLLTHRIRRTEYLKGKLLFKVKFESISNPEPYNSTSMIWLFPYWKKTKTNAVFQEPILSIEEIEKEFNDIKMAAHRSN